METNTVGLVATITVAGLSAGAFTSGGIADTAFGSAGAVPSAATTSAAGGADAATYPLSITADETHAPPTRVHHEPSFDLSNTEAVFVTMVHPVAPSGAIRGAPSTAMSTVGCCVRVIAGTSVTTPGVELPRAFTNRMFCSKMGRVVVIATT